MDRTRRAFLIRLSALSTTLALRSSKVLADPAGATPLPKARGGQDLVGTPFPTLDLHWARAAPPKADGTPSITLYRWWTETCPYCEATLPAVELLRTTYEAKGLATVGIYHPKPPRAVDDDHVLSAADRRGYHGPVAVDADWSQLKKAWLSTGDRKATSVSFLVDRKGITRFVHPGVMYFPKSQREDAEPNRDFESLDRAIQVLLAD